MTETMTLAQVRDKCVERDLLHVDQTVNLTSLRMDAKKPGKLLVQRGKDAPTHEYGFDDHVYKLFPRVLPGLPAEYLRKLVEKEPELAARNFNFWVKDVGDKGVLLRFRRDAKAPTDQSLFTIRAVLPEKWQPLNYATAVNHMIERWGKDQPATLTALNEAKFALDIVYGDVKKEAVVGDIVKWGARYSDSDVGFGKIGMAAFTHRLRCLNGAVHVKDGVGTSIAHTDKAFDSPAEVYGMLTNGIDSINTFANFLGDGFQKAHSIKLEDPTATRLRINERFSVTKLEDEWAVEGWNREDDLEPTAYRLMQAYTRAANSTEIPLESKFRLQSVGGNILNLVGANYRFN